MDTAPRTRGRGEGVRVVERREVEATPLALRESDHTDHDEDGEDDQLTDQHHLVDLGGHLDTQVVDGRVEHDEADQPHPYRDGREQRVHRDTGDQVEQSRDQHIVEQDHPPGQEAHRGGDPTTGVGVDGASHRECLRHLRVGECGEHHRNHADGVGQGHHPAGTLEDATKDAERRDRHHEHQSVDQQVSEAQGAVQLLLVAISRDVVGDR